MKKHNCFFLLAIFFAACASAPKVSFPPEQEIRELFILPAGAKVYLWADAVKGRPLIDAFSSVYFSGDRISDVIDSTQSVAAAMFPAQSQGRSFFLAASGSYPRFMANFSFFFSRGWQRLKSAGGSSYWHSRNDNISLALGSKLALVSNTDPYEDFAFEIPPDGFAEFSRGRALAGWVNDPSDSINNFLSSVEIPLQVPAEDLFFGADNSASNHGSADKESWELVFRIRTASQAQARSLLTLFSMARRFAGDGITLESNASSLNPQEMVALFFANTPEQDGNTLTLRMGPLDETRIALLFSMFSLYSN